MAMSKVTPLRQLTATCRRTYPNDLSRAAREAVRASGNCAGLGDTSTLQGETLGPEIVKGVDPRDIDWEDSAPVFRVHFRDPQRQGATTEFELTEGDVFEVLAWARTMGRPMIRS